MARGAPSPASCAAQRRCPALLVALSLVAVVASNTPPPAAPYNETLAGFGHVLSQAAYCSKSVLLNWTSPGVCPPCARAASLGLTPISPVQVFNGKVGGFKKVTDLGTQGFVTAFTGGRIVVSFRGSSNLTNWLEDFDAVGMVPYEDACPGCTVHEGFFKSWMSIALDVSSAVASLKAQHPHADILVTGHSLGAAMAVLAATHFYYRQGLPVTHVITFGQPRVGNAAFHQFYNNGSAAGTQYGGNGSSFRVVHWRDPVPHLPPVWLGFQHTSTEVWYTEDNGDFVVCDGSGEDPLCSASLPLTLLYAEDHCNYLGLPICGC